MLNLSLETFFILIESMGIISFALSGILVARQYDFDPVGTYVIACSSAFGGGTIRDILLDRSSIYWFQHSEYPILIFFMVLFFYFVKNVKFSVNWLLIPEAVGLALFTVSGAQIAIDSGVSPIIVAILATITASFGGLVQDLMCNRVPTLFLKGVNLYATGSFIGGFIYVGLLKLNLSISFISGVVFLFVLLYRLLAIRYKIHFK